MQTKGRFLISLLRRVLSWLPNQEVRLPKYEQTGKGGQDFSPSAALD